MQFDILSFLIGVVVTAGIAFILYRQRGQLAAVRQTAESQAGSTQRYITSSAESRYSTDVIKLLNSYHVAGDIIKLTDIYVEPRFMTALEPVDLSEDKPLSVFHVVPRIHYMPAAYAPYNIETLTINELQAGEPHLALLGIPGCGKSTALAILGLYAIREIEIEVIDVMSDAVFEDEIKNLPPDQREKLIQQRQATQERALEHLQQAQERRQEEEENKKSEKTEQVKRPVVDFHQLLPILFHLRDIDLQPSTYGVQTAASKDGKDGKDGKNSSKQTLKKLDPAEPLVKALQQRFGAITASTIPHLIYNRLNAGTCLVLIDGYEDIAPGERAEKLAWLQQFIAVYGANFIVVTGPAIGFDPLLHLGLTPVFLRAWADTEFDHLIERWALAWPTAGGTGRKRAAMPDERLIRRAQTNNRGRLPFDVTLKTWAAFSGDEHEVGRPGWYDFYVRHAEVTKEQRPIIEKMAAAMLDQGGAPLTREKMKEIAASTGDGGKPAANVDDVVGKLAGLSNLIANEPDNRCGFVHPLLTGFLASGALDAERLAAVATNPAWESAMPFAAARLPMDRAVTARLGAAPDLLYSNLFGLVLWLPDAPLNTAWRTEIFRRLTAALLAPRQYPAIRERAMAALIASRDKNITFILRQALLSPDPVIRQLGCIGFGALGEGEALKDLGPRLGDGDVDVRLAAGLALGAIGSEAALKMMETTLKTMEPGSHEDDPQQQEFRRAVAEALAALPGPGHAILRDAITHPETMVRRAVVFGLARVKAAWALALLYRAMEDSQWFVQNAAEQAFMAAERLDEGGAQRHPEAESLPWLIRWANQRGDGVPAGLAARQVLIRALQDGDEPIIRAASALTLANLGHMPALKPLYTALRDKDDAVRAAVFEALGNFQGRLGEDLPAVA